MTLKAGALPGTSHYVGANNHGNTHIGRIQLNAGVALNSSLVIGDQMTMDGVTNGEALEHHTGVQHTALVTDCRSVLGGYSCLNYVLNGAFEPLDAEGDSDTYSAFVSHPLWLSHLCLLEAAGAFLNLNVSQNTTPA